MSLSAACLAECDRRDTLSAAATGASFGEWWTHEGAPCVYVHPVMSVSSVQTTTPELAALIVDARNSYDRMTALARHVLGVHRGNSYGGCTGCPGVDCCCEPKCEHLMDTPWPCPSVLAVAAALGVEAE